MRTTPDPYRGFRFPAEIISHAVWLYHCFGLSLREVETILAERGVVVSHESIRAWGLRFGRAFATALKRRRPRPGDKWHLDEVFIRIRGKAPLPLAGGRPARHRARRSGPEPAQCQGGQALLQEVAEGVTVRASCRRDRQAQELRRGEARDPARGRAPPEPVLEQPRRGLAPADATTRTADAAVQVTAAGPAVPLQPRSDPQPVPAPPPPSDRQRASSRP